MNQVKENGPIKGKIIDIRPYLSRLTPAKSELKVLEKNVVSPTLIPEQQIEQEKELGALIAYFITQDANWEMPETVAQKSLKKQIQALRKTYALQNGKSFIPAELSREELVDQGIRVIKDARQIEELHWSQNSTQKESLKRRRIAEKTIFTGVCNKFFPDLMGKMDDFQIATHPLFLREHEYGTLDISAKYPEYKINSYHYASEYFDVRLDSQKPDQHIKLTAPYKDWGRCWVVLENKTNSGQKMLIEVRTMQSAINSVPTPPPTH